MFNIFKKNSNKKINKSLNNLANSINKATNNKEDLEDFILILRQIQEINNQKTTGKGSVLKNYTYKKNGIENTTQLAIEKYAKKIKEWVSLNVPVDTYGVGTSFVNNMTCGFTGDLVVLDGKPEAKEGRKNIPSDRLKPVNYPIY